MPIPLYISPNTPLPGPADFTTPIMAAFQARNRRKETEQQATLERERMAAQQKESQADRQQRGEHQKETSEYNRGMLDLYKGDRERSSKDAFMKDARAAQAEYLQALARQKEDPGALVRAEQKLRSLGITPPANTGAPTGQSQGGAPGTAPPSSFRTVPLDLGGPLPMRGLY